MHLNKTDSDNPNYDVDYGRLRLKESKYAADFSTSFPEEFSELYHKIAKDTNAKFSNATMMISLSQAQFLHEMVQLLRPSRILEIGSFTGASAVAMGSALDPEGALLSLDIDLEALNLARSIVDSSSLKQKVSFKHGPAIDSINELAKKTPHVQFDLIFIDADKPGYIKYYDLIMEHNLLSDNGIILADNVLFYGQVHREAGYEEPLDYGFTPEINSWVKALGDFNRHVQQDPRTEVIIFPIFDGVSLIRKKRSNTIGNSVAKSNKL